MKYIVLQVGSFQCPVLFPTVLEHKEVAKSITEGLAEKHGTVEVLSAGFAQVAVESADGDSFSLKLSSRPEDLPLMRMVARL